MSIRRLVNFIRLFRLLAELVPGVDEFVDKQLETFIKNPDLRIKDHFASLGDLLAYSVVSKKFKFADLKESYLEEQLDRQAFWIIKAIPELDHTDPKYKGKELIMEEARNEVCFKTGLVGFQMTMVFFSLCEALENTYNKDFGKLCADLDSNFGCLSDKAESQLQKKFQAIQKVENFNKYYTWLGQQCLDLDALSTRLRKAIDNSKAKKYHGNSDHMNELPTMAEQAKDFILKEPSPFSHFDEKAQKFTKDANDLWWKKASEDKFLKVKNMLLQFSDKNLKPADVAELVDREELVYFEDREFNKLKSLHEESSNTKYILEEI